MSLPWDTWQEAAAFAVVALVLYLAVIWAAAIFWTARDIRSRHNSGTVQLASTALVAVFFLPGLWIYRITRPPRTLAERYERALEAEAVRYEISQQLNCPKCSRRVRDDFLVCPSCGTRLKDACLDCGRPLSYGWVACPQCGHDHEPVALPGPKTAKPAAAAIAAPAPEPATPKPQPRLRKQHPGMQRPPSADPFMVSRRAH